MKSTRLWVPSLALAGIAAAVYLNTLPAQFTFDDNFAVITNGDVADPEKPVWKLFKNDYWGQELSSEHSHKSYRPLTILSFRLQRIVGQSLFGAMRAEYVRQMEAEGKHDNSRGLDPFIFHLSNVVAHAMVTVLVFRLALRLIASRHQQFSATLSPSTQDLVEAFVAALLFAVHPVHTEAVAGIVGHAEMLCASLSIMGLLNYMAAADGRVSSLESHWRHVAIAVVLGWAAALTKEIGVTIMGAMACYDLLVSPLTITFQPLAAHNTSIKHRKHGGTGASSSKSAIGVGRSGGFVQHGLGVKLLRLLATVAGVLIYARLRSFLAGDQLVRIYRKVENPIPFSESSLERKLTTGYLHSRYFGLLLAPVQLSADWSYACIEYVSDLKDPRNLATLAVYLLIITVFFMARPWRVLAQWAGRLQSETSPAEQARRWRLAVFTGLVVGPYFPASNVLFYVGTFIGERLMYFPSIGFCILVSEWVAPPLLPIVESYLEEGTKGRFGTRTRRFGPKAMVTACLLGALVTLFTLKTLHRNSEWYDEERLFRSAQKVCWRSAKVQLNSGILERRYRDWDNAIAHFREAQDIDETFCEPDYHIGITMVSAGKDFDIALNYLEKGVSCKYTAADAVKALNQIFATLLSDPKVGGAMVGARWAKVLALPAIKRYSESLRYCEQTAMLHAKAGSEELTKAALDSCQEILDNATPSLEGPTSDYPIRVAASPELLATLRKCLTARTPVLLAIAAAPGDDASKLNVTAVRQAAYHYIAHEAEECRKPLPVEGAEPGSEDYQQRSGSMHAELVHLFQKADPGDAWLHQEWSQTMFAQGRAREGILHSEVAGQLLKMALKQLLKGQKSTSLGLDGAPLTHEEAGEGALANYQRSLAYAKLPKVAQQLVDQQGRPIRVDCILQVHICEVHQALSSASVGTSGISLAAIQEASEQLSRCLQEAQRMGCPMGTQQAQHDDSNAGFEDEEEAEGEGETETKEQQQRSSSHGEEL